MPNCQYVDALISNTVCSLLSVGRRWFVVIGQRWAVVAVGALLLLLLLQLLQS